MNDRRIWLALAAVSLAACSSPEPKAPDSAEPPPPFSVEARAAVDRAVATTGDLITYSVTVERDPAFEVEIPEAGAEIAGFRIVDVGRDEPREENGRLVERRWYQLRADLVGSYVLPPVTVTYRRQAEEGEPAEPEDQSIETSAIFVEVESVLPETGEASDIMDIKPLQPRTSRVPWVRIVAGAVFLLGLGVAATLLWRRGKKQPPPAPPHEVAFRALDALRGTNFDDPEEVRRFYFAISEVLRGYVEGRFGLNATDLTSDEILGRLDEVSGLEADPERELRRFLVDTDQVKFAAHRPTQEEIGQTYECGLGFVEATRPPATGEEATTS
jgi:hypothetical protein